MSISGFSDGLWRKYRFVNCEGMKLGGCDREVSVLFQDVLPVNEKDKLCCLPFSDRDCRR